MKPDACSIYAIYIRIDSPVIKRMVKAGTEEIESSSAQTFSSGTSEGSNVTNETADKHDNHSNIAVANTAGTESASKSNYNSSIPTTAEFKSADSVLLFARIVGEPYCCLGRLAFINCNFDRHPLVVYWRLQNFDDIIGGPTKGTEQFKRMLSVSPMS